MERRKGSEEGSRKVWEMRTGRKKGNEEGKGKLLKGGLRSGGEKEERKERGGEKMRSGSYMCDANQHAF